MTSFVDRMIGAAKLDVHIYEEVESDPAATGQAAGVVVLSSIAAGIGSLHLGPLSMLSSAVVHLILWALWAFVTYLIGTRVLPEPDTKADFGELLRTLGFASSPGILQVVRIVPVLGTLLGFMIFLWLLLAMVVAVRQALDYKSTPRAVAVCLIGFILYVVAGTVLLPFLAVRPA